MLQSLTTGINFIGLIATIGMGAYLVIRGSRRPEAWLLALAAWAMGGYFLNYLLALHPPPAPPPEIKVWLYHFMLFWPRDVFELGWKSWLLGWLPVYSIIFWYHATLYMLPGSFTWKRVVGAALGYAAAVAGILIKTYYRDIWIGLIENPLYNPQVVFPFFALFAAGFMTFAGLSVVNLTRITRSSLTSIPRAQFWLFIYAIITVGAAGSLGILSNLLEVLVPQALTASFLVVALALIGIGVAKYNFPIHQDSRKLPNLAEIKENFGVDATRSEKLTIPGEISFRDVELALRNLHNYSYLADSPLSKLPLVVQRCECFGDGVDTHIDRGRAVSDVISEAVSMLKPSKEDMPTPPPRTWYPYIVLWDAYVENKPNLEIMSRLYISEGTFNRTRKAAIGSIARLLQEIEPHSE